jgi:hypothetical protein
VTPHRPHRRPAIVATVVVAIIGAIAGVVIAVVGVSGDPAAAASYCSAARRVDDYRGPDAGHLVSLLDRVQQLAPAEIAPVVATMRHTDVASPAFGAARTAWGHYNTNHCCTCIGGPNLPQVVSTAP